MAGEIVSSTTSSDQEKFLAAKLIQRSYIKLVAASMCEKITMEQGAGLTAYFVRYSRMNVPLTTITEGTDPANSSFSLSTVQVTLDQWGDIITITDVAQLTTKHPLLQQCMELLSDNAARVMDREVQLVWLAGTNVQYADGTVATRRLITTADKISDQVIQKARITMVNNGAPPRGGPSGDAKAVEANGTFTQGQAYVGVCGPEVLADITGTSTSLGTWASVASYNNAKALYNAEVGTWLGIRWVETNFIPTFSILGNTTAAIASAAADGGGITGFVITAVTSGGALNDSTTFFYKIVRKDLLRGFEEAISIAHSTATGAAATANDNSFTMLMPSTAGYVYNVYFDTVATGGTGTDATLKLSTAGTNVAASATATITSVGTGATAPDNVNPTGTPNVYPVFLFAAEALNWVGFYNLQVKVTKDESIIGNVLQLKRAVGYKFFGKAMIRDQTRLLRLEVTASY